jgi:hypothetical protein
MTDHRDGSACVGAVVRKPPGKESAEDDVVTMTRALWRFDRAMFAQRLVYSPWFSRLGSQALRCRLLARSCPSGMSPPPVATRSTPDMH